MKEKETMINIISQILKTGSEEAKELIRIIEYKPLIISEALDVAKELQSQISWGIIVKALTNLTKYSIDYSQIQTETVVKRTSLTSDSILEEVNILKEYIESIEIDDNGICYGEISYAMDSIYSDIGDNFKELLLDEIDLDEFYDKASDLIIKNIKDEITDQIKEPIASYTICNNASLLIFDIDYFEDAVLVGTSYQDAKWYLVHDSSFFYGDNPFSLDEFIRV